MAPAIRPLAADMRLAGVAATVHCVAVDGVPDDHSEWHRGTIEAVDALEPGDVLVASTCEAAFWGELLATASRRRGARGVVADAYARDTLELIDMGFATFARGIWCADALGRIRVDAPTCRSSAAASRCDSGDHSMLGDHDGVVVLPAAVAARQIDAGRGRRSRARRRARRAREGMTLAEACGDTGSGRGGADARAGLKLRRVPTRAGPSSDPRDRMAGGCVADAEGRPAANRAGPRRRGARDHGLAGDVTRGSGNAAPLRRAQARTPTRGVDAPGSPGTGAARARGVQR